MNFIVTPIVTQKAALTALTVSNLQSTVTV